MIDFDRLVLAPCVRVFGRPIVYLPGDGRTIQACGVFNNRFHDQSYTDDQTVRMTHPMVSVRASTLPCTPVQGELIGIDAVLYRITAVDPDGMGDLRIHLTAATDLETKKAAPLPWTSNV